MATQSYTLGGKTYTTSGAIPVGGTKTGDSTGTYTQVDSGSINQNQNINTTDQYIAPASMPGYGGNKRKVLNPNYKPVGTNEIKDTTDINLPTKNYTDYTGLIQGANLTQTNPLTGVTGTEKGITITPPPDTQVGLAEQTNKTLTDRFKEMLGLIPQRENVQADIMQSQQYKQVEEARQQVQNYTNQLNAIQTKLQADILAQTGQGRGIPEAVIGGIQAQLSKEAAIKSLPLQALLASAQGMFDIAQRHLDDLYKLRTEEVNNKYDYQKQVFGAISSFIDKQDQRAYDAATKDLEFKRAKDLKIEEKRSELMANAVSRGAGSSYINAISNAKDMVSLVRGAGKYNIDAKDAASILKTNSEISNANPVNYTGEFGATIDAVGNMETTVAGKASVKNSLKQAIANKDYVNAYNQIANTVESNLVGESKQRYTNARTDYQVMSGLRTAIENYANQGGNMGLLKGTEEQIKRKLGIDSGKASTVAVELWREFQTYRNTMTGAAFSPGESRDYASVNPSLGKSLNLNLNVIDGAMNQLENRVTGTIQARVPSAKYILDYAKNPQLGQNKNTTQQLDPNDPLGIFK